LTQAVSWYTSCIVSFSLYYTKTLVIVGA